MLEYFTFYIHLLENKTVKLKASVWNIYQWILSDSLCLFSECHLLFFFFRKFHFVVTPNILPPLKMPFFWYTVKKSCRVQTKNLYKSLYNKQKLHIYVIDKLQIWTQFWGDLYWSTLFKNCFLEYNSVWARHII
jgi:hypothetical protein